MLCPGRHRRAGSRALGAFCGAALGDEDVTRTGAGNRPPARAEVVDAVLLARGLMAVRISLTAGLLLLAHVRAEGAPCAARHRDNGEMR